LQALSSVGAAMGHEPGLLSPIDFRPGHMGMAVDDHRVSAFPRLRRPSPHAAAWRSLTDHVVINAVGLVADVLEDILVGRPTLIPRRGPRPGVGSWVVDRDLVPQGADVRPRDALDQVQPFRVRITFPMHPEPLVEADRVDDERVAVPMTDRMPEVARVDIVEI